MKYAYLNLFITSINEDPDAEREALLAKIAGPDDLYIERLNARTKMMDVFAKAQSGDTIYIYSFARFCSGLRDLCDLIAELDAKGVTLVSLTDNFDSSTEAGKTKIEAFNQAKALTWADPSHGLYK